MLNPKTGERELAYVTIIDDIQPIKGSDNCECAVIGGWHVMVRKGAFHIGDPAVYFEIDSKLDPSNPAFAFMSGKKYRVKTQRYTFGGKGNFISQGLIMSAENLGWKIIPQYIGDKKYLDILDDDGIKHGIDNESRFLTKKLNITYYIPEDNKRKADSFDKYKKMAQRNSKLFSHYSFRWLMRRMWGKKLLFIFFGKKRDKRNAWPSHICSKTDVERIQNMPYILKDKSPYIATEKVDGSSCTIAAEKIRFGKIKYYICSRNVVFENENQSCYYDSNIYWEMWNKYNFKEKITQILKDLNLSNIALQMEVYGQSVQKRDYSLNERKVAIFHIVSNTVKMPIDKVVEICNKYELPCIPIINNNYTLPDTIDELQEYVESAPSMIDNKIKEGIVFYDKETGQKYFKFVSPEFLIKYH